MTPTEAITAAVPVPKASDRVLFLMLSIISEMRTGLSSTRIPQCFAIERTTNGKVKIYINGADTGAQAPSSDPIPSNGLPLYLGSEGNDSLQNGLMNNFIWINYPFDGCPSSPWVPDPGTLLSIFQGNDLSQLITDNSGNSYTITNGSGIFNADNPFGSGGSIQFGTI